MDPNGRAIMDEIANLIKKNNLNCDTAVGTGSKDAPTESVSCRWNFQPVEAEVGYSPFFDRRWTNDSVLRATFSDRDWVERAVRLCKNAAACEKLEPDDTSVSFFIDRRWSNGSVLNATCGNLHSFERAAEICKIAPDFSKVNRTWSGHLLPRTQNYIETATYSSKVFLCGIPSDMTEEELVENLSCFGAFKTLWSGKNRRGASYPEDGQAYIIFEDEGSVRALLGACDCCHSNGGEWYFNISSRCSGPSKVQVYPWVKSDNKFGRHRLKTDISRTVFVKAKYGMLNAVNLAMIMNDLFGGVVSAKIDTNKQKYPIGSGRVTFNNYESYMEAVIAAIIKIETPAFTRKLQVYPYLEESICCICDTEATQVFCRDITCFKYYCWNCWY